MNKFYTMNLMKHCISHLLFYVDVIKSLYNKEELEDTKIVVRIHKSKKDRTKQWPEEK